LHAVVQAAISEACADVGIAVAELSLSFQVFIWAGAENGRFYCYGSSSVDLRETLQQRVKLLNARAGGWPSLRAAWIDFLSMQTAPRETAGGRRLGRAKTMEEAIAHVDARWRCSEAERKRYEAKVQKVADKLAAKRERMEAREKKRAERASSKREAAINCAHRAARAVDRRLHRAESKARRVQEIAHRQEAARRRREKELASKTRWAWLNSKDRTMAEILQGLPHELRPEKKS